jgi:hypothetical protein
VWKNHERAIDQTAGKLADLDRGKKGGEWRENPNASADEF